jgi:predicted nucleic acid-binding protein
MIAVDSSVLLAIFKGEPTGEAWLNFLLRLRTENPLAACDVVWAEVAPLFSTLPALRTGMSQIGVHFSPLDEAACFAAGQLFAGYRKRGGVRQRLIADFLIAGHALEHTSGLATADDDFMRAHFPRLKIFKP